MDIKSLIKNVSDAIDTRENTKLASYAKTTSLPTKLTDLTNDAGFITSADLPTSLEGLDNSVTKYQSESQVEATITGKGYQTAEQVGSIVTTKVAELIDSSDEDFDTLKEMSAWISSHAESAAAMNAEIAKKYEKPEGGIPLTDIAMGGKVLSTEDFTTELKTKLTGIDMSTKVDKVEGKGLSTNDYTDVDKAKVDAITIVDGKLSFDITASEIINIVNGTTTE